MTGESLYQFLKSLQKSERGKLIMLSRGPLDHKPLLEIDDMDPDFVYLRTWVEAASDN